MAAARWLPSLTLLFMRSARFAFRSLRLVRVRGARGPPMQPPRDGFGFYGAISPFARAIEGVYYRIWLHDAENR